MSKRDAFGETLREVAGKLGDPGLQHAVEVGTLRADVTRLKAERKRWQVLVAAILQQHGEIRVSKAVQAAIDKPTILVTDDPVTGELVLRLKEGTQ